MPTRCLTLLADDPALAGDLQALLEAHLECPVARSPLPDAWDRLAHAGDGLVLAAAATRADCARLFGLLRQAPLPSPPTVLLVLRAGAALPAPEAAALDRYLCGHLHWPEEAAALVDAVRQRAQAPTGPGGPHRQEVYERMQETVIEIRRASLHEQLEKVDPKGNIVLDFALMDYIASTGLGSIMALYKRVKREGGKLVLRNMKPEIYEVFLLTNLDTLLKIELTEPQT